VSIFKAGPGKASLPLMTAAQIAAAQITAAPTALGRSRQRRRSKRRSRPEHATGAGSWILGLLALRRTVDDHAITLLSECA